MDEEVLRKESWWPMEVLGSKVNWGLARFAKVVTRNTED